MLLAVPASASAGTFTPAKNPGAWKLKQVGLGKVWLGRADQLARTYPRVGLQGVLGDLNRDTGPLNAGAAPAGATGYSWEGGDNTVDYWTPQGMSGQDGVHVQSWYRGKSGSETDVRLSFVGPQKKHYRFALAVRPTGGSGYARVGIHAGGLAWYGNYLYMADTSVGFRVFDTSRLLRVPDNRLKSTGGYRYLLPQIGYYRNTGAKLRYSASAIDRSNPSNLGLVAGEYLKPSDKGTTRIVRWRVNPQTGKLASAAAVGAWTTGFKQLQGVTMDAGRIYVSSSATSRGQLYYGKPKKKARVRPWGQNPEALYVEGSSLWSFTEPKGVRTVFARPLGSP